MSSGRRALLTTLLALFLGAPLGAPGPASGAVSFGSNLGRDPMLNTNCTLPCTTANIALANSNRVRGNLDSPATGTITSFAVRSGSAGAVSLRVLRPTGVATFSGAGSSSPVPIGVGVTGPIPVALPIKAGDAIGLDNPGAHLVLAANGGASQIFWTPPLLDGANLTGATAGGLETMVQATVEPTNVFQVGLVSRDKKKGSARMAVTVPNAGRLTYSGNQVSVQRVGGGSSKQTVKAGVVTVKVKAKAGKKKQLDGKGKAKVSPVFTYTPTDGLTSVQSTTVQLRQKVKKK